MPQKKQTPFWDVCSYYILFALKWVFKACEDFKSGVY